MDGNIKYAYQSICNVGETLLVTNKDNTKLWSFKFILIEKHSTYCK